MVTRNPSHTALPPETVDAAIDAALREDVGDGDRTTEVVVGEEARARGRLVARAPGTLAGLAVFERVFERLDPACRTERHAQDGDPVVTGICLAEVRGPARALLVGERTALNFVQRLSGVATTTARFVALAAGRVRILDTRKTTPGLRLLEKHAVRCGGGENHRIGLFDEAMVKDNHLDFSGGGQDVGSLVRALRERHGSGLRITAEARDEAEALSAARAGADVVMLDNLAPGEMARIVPLLRTAGSAELEIEASGGVDETTLDAIAGCGVDRVSIGALTHSAPALDLALELEPLP